MITIDAKGMYYRNLNNMVRDAVNKGEKEILLKNVNGQYYIADGLRGNDIQITIEGVPGNDLCAFMDGPTIIVKANAQDNLCNTMNQGKVVVHGNAGDVLGYGMRGGKLYIKGDIGYRVGIHMKGYQDQVPVIIAGGTARDFFGEYMAGGLLILLGNGAQEGHPVVGDYLGTGMHGGLIFIKGVIDPYQCGKEVGIDVPNEKEREMLNKYISEYSRDFDLDFEELITGDFVKIYPKTARPYGRMYAY